MKKKEVRKPFYNIYAVHIKNMERWLKKHPISTKDIKIISSPPKKKPTK